MTQRQQEKKTRRNKHVQQSKHAKKREVSQKQRENEYSNNKEANNKEEAANISKKEVDIHTKSRKNHSKEKKNKEKEGNKGGDSRAEREDHSSRIGWSGKKLNKERITPTKKRERKTGGEWKENKKKNDGTKN